MSDVWAIFSDKSSCKIDITLVADKTFNFTAVAIDNSYVINTAEKAISASIGYMESVGLNNPEKKCGIIFSFKGNDSISGSSASLAFALKMAYKTKEYNEGIYVPFSIAATGSVDSISKDDHVEKIDYINQKIEAALDVLNNGDYIFFPVDNFPEILKKNIERCHKKGVQLIAVSTISDAVKKLLELTDIVFKNSTNKLKSTDNVNNKKSYKWFLIICMCVALFVLYFFSTLHEEKRKKETPQKELSLTINQIDTTPEKKVSDNNFSSLEQHTTISNDLKIKDPSDKRTKDAKK